MDKNLVIGVIGKPNRNYDGDALIGLPNNLKSAIVENNAIPLIICPKPSIEYHTLEDDEIPEVTQDDKNYYNRVLELCDGLILPGGNRIHNFEYYIVKVALEMDIPILGICNGNQLLSIVDYGKIELLKNSDTGTNINHKQKDALSVHDVLIKKDSLLYKILNKERISVNSNHNYSVANLCDFEVVASAEDGIIEAIESSNHSFVLGVQWHPESFVKVLDKVNEYKGLDEEKYREYLAIYEDSIKIFNSFFEACNIYKKERKNNINLVKGMKNIF